MCGRFVGFRNIEQLKQYFPIDEAVGSDAVANYNVAPTQQILAIARHDGRNILERYHWGLVPFWAKDRSIGYKMINARVETVAAKPSFRRRSRSGAASSWQMAFTSGRERRAAGSRCTSPCPKKSPSPLPVYGRSGTTRKKRGKPTGRAPSSHGPPKATYSNCTTACR